MINLKYVMLATCLLMNNVSAAPSSTKAVSNDLITSESNSPVKYNQDIHKYVQDLIDNSFSILNDKTIAKLQKVSKSELLMEKNLDIDWMADFSLGRQKKNLSPAQLSKYHEVYKKYVIKTYAQRIKDYGGEKITIKDVRKINNDASLEEYAVTTVITKPSQNNSINANFMVRKRDNNFFIFDIVTEVSLITAQRSEFSSIIVSQGFEALIKSLEQKIANK